MRALPALTQPVPDRVDKRLRDPVERADFERHGWMSPMNAEAIFVFWEDLDPNAAKPH